MAQLIHWAIIDNSWAFSRMNGWQSKRMLDMHELRQTLRHLNISEAWQRVKELVISSTFSKGDQPRQAEKLVEVSLQSTSRRHELKYSGISRHVWIDKVTEAGSGILEAGSSSHYHGLMRWIQNERKPLKYGPLTICTKKSTQKPQVSPAHPEEQASLKSVYCN